MLNRTKIFIGGTGRSGTTILYDILGRHSDIFALKDEIRFIIDYNGIINLIDALTINYSPSQGGRAIAEFENLLLNDLTNPKSSPYPWYKIQDYLGKELYIEKVSNFLDKLMIGRFEGQAAWLKDVGYEHPTLLKRKVNRRIPLFSKEALKISSIPIPKYFSNRKDLIGLVNLFLEDLFLSATQNNKKSIWCEKTPYNILHHSFINEVFPEALFIHIKRDPRSVVQSYYRQTWAPNTLEECSLLLKNVFRKWLDEKQKIDLDNANYIEVKLEEFAANPRETLLDKIQEYFKLKTDFELPSDLNPVLVNKAKKKLTKEEMSIINEILKEEIIEMDYKL